MTDAYHCRGVGASIARIVFFFDFDAPGRQVIYVGLLESGMTITVVSLPSIWWLFSSTVPEKLVPGLQSLCSLGSNDSRRSSETRVNKEDETDEPYRPMYFDGRNISMVRSYCSTGRTYSADDPEMGKYMEKESEVMREIGPNVIGVEHKIEVKHY